MSNPTASTAARSGPAAARALTLLMCAAQFFTMLSMSVYAAQLPLLRDLWALSHTEAGWIGAAYFAGYTLAVPVLTSLTDRVDPKRIYVLGTMLLFLGCAGFGALAQGFMTATLFHALAGAGLAGSYMPGLKALLDQIDQAYHSRATAFYTASYGFGAAFSYPFSSHIGDWLGWEAAFYGNAVAALAAALLVLVALPSARRQPTEGSGTWLLDFRPVLRNRAAITYTIGYALHCWELFGIRTWIIAFLVYAERLHGDVPALIGPAAIAAYFTLLGVPASIFGNEVAMRVGRRRFIITVMLGSAVVCALAGLTADVSYGLAAAVCLLLGVVIMLDSATVTAGALGSAKPGLRGATMGVHATLGFGGAALGPLVFGLMLDVAGGEGAFGWWIGFGQTVIVLLAGAILMAVLKAPPIPGDRR